MSDGALWERDEARFVKKRAEFLDRAVGMDRKKARAVAWSELGYSEAGISAQLNVTAGTVGSWLDDIERDYAKSVALAKRPDQLKVDAPVEGGRHE